MKTKTLLDEQDDKKVALKMDIMTKHVLLKSTKLMKKKWCFYFLTLSTFTPKKKKKKRLLKKKREIYGEKPDRTP